MNANPALIPAAIPDGLDEPRIAALIDRFYDKVSADPLLGAVFNPVIADWAAHKRLLTSFWCSVALHVRTYRGNPLGAHRPHPIRIEHFERWLALWRETTHEVLDADAADVMCAYAERIGMGMKLGLDLLPLPKRR
ncbi:MAG: group III truncated hemoglobin [Proteobacteria bacterium]|nr:group III truncated hemoglobin [Pseudomonadota bacterium]